MSLIERIGLVKKGEARVVTLGTRDVQVVPSGRPFTAEQIIAFVTKAESGDTRYLCAFYDEMRATDAHLDGELSKAEDYLTGARYDVLPYPPRIRGASNASKREARRATDIAYFVEENLFAPNVRLDRAIVSLADGLWKGVGGFEVTTKPGAGTGGRERLGEIVQIPSQRFRYIPQTTTLALQLGLDEQALTPVDSLGAKVVWLVSDPEIPSPGRRGIMRRCISAWFIRRYAPQQWSRFVELHGSPMRIGKFTPGDDAMQKALIEALKNMGAAAWAAIPDGAAIELLEANARSTGNPPHELLTEWAAREISKVVLGATQTADVQRNTGSRASASVHHDVTIARSAARANIIAAVLREQLIRPLVARNFGDAIAEQYTPELKIRVESKPDVYNSSQAIRMLANAGMKTIPIAYLHDYLSIPVPDPEEPCLELPLLPGVVPPQNGDPASDPNPAKPDAADDDSQDGPDSAQEAP